MGYQCNLCVNGGVVVVLATVEEFKAHMAAWHAGPEAEVTEGVVLVQADCYDAAEQQEVLYCSANSTALTWHPRIRT